MKKILLVSLKFSPGHYSHLIAYYLLFEELGYKVEIVLDEKYKEIIPENNYNIYYLNTNNNQKLYKDDIKFIFFQNPSTKNIKFLKNFKKINSKVKSMYLYHEPWDGIGQRIKEGSAILKYLMINIYQKYLILNSDIILLPSEIAYKNYEKYEKKYNSNYYKTQLIFANENNENNKSEKKYFSYIGTVTESHNFIKYIDVIKYINKKDKDIKFAIFTKSDISKYLDIDLKRMIQGGTIVIKHGKNLTNVEINEAYKNSFCIWNFYKRSTQSGVLPKAYMFSTPVLASNLEAFFKNVLKGKTGEILELDADNEIIFNAIQKIRNEIKIYSKNCLSFFYEKFEYKSQKKTFENIIKKEWRS